MKSQLKILIVLLTAQLIGQANATIANVAAPAIRNGLHATGAATELMLAAYLITFAVLIITGARLGHMYGYKRVFMLGIGIFGVSSLLSGFALNIEQLIVGRALQGIGVAIMFPQTLTGIQLIFSGRARIRAMGFYSMALAGGAIVGQVLGGVLLAMNIAGTEWRALFWWYVPICAAIIWLAAKLLPADTNRSPARLDMLGVMLLSLAILLIIVPLTIGREMGWPIWAWGALGTSLPVLWLFIKTQKHQEHRLQANPLISVSTLSHRTVLWGLMGMLLATSVYYAFIFVFALYNQGYLGNTALFTAILLSPWAVGFASSGQIVQRLAERFGIFFPCLSYILFTLAFIGMSLVHQGTLPAFLLLVTLFILSGIGQGAGFIRTVTYMTDVVPRQYAAELSGVVTTTIEISGALGVALFGGLYATLDVQGAARAFSISCLLFAVTTFVASIAVYMAAKSSVLRHDSTPSH